jgi:hypothetical protein
MADRIAKLGEPAQGGFFDQGFVEGHGWEAVEKVEEVEIVQGVRSVLA